VSPAKTGKASEMPFALRTRVGPKEHLLGVAEAAELFQPNTVLWAFHTIQPSSCTMLTYACICCFGLYRPKLRHCGKPSVMCLYVFHEF